MDPRSDGAVFIPDPISCDNGNQYTLSVQNGSIIDIENITVPAGTFSAKKMQYDITQTNTASGTATTRHVTIWYDVVSGRELQSISDYNYVNRTATTGYLAHEQMQLLTPP